VSSARDAARSAARASTSATLAAAKELALIRRRIGDVCRLPAAEPRSRSAVTLLPVVWAAAAASECPAGSSGLFMLVPGAAVRPASAGADPAAAAATPALPAAADGCSSADGGGLSPTAEASTSVEVGGAGGGSAGEQLPPDASAVWQSAALPPLPPLPVLEPPPPPWLDPPPEDPPPEEHPPPKPEARLPRSVPRSTEEEETDELAAWTSLGTPCSAAPSEPRPSSSRTRRWSSVPRALLAPRPPLPPPPATTSAARPRISSLGSG
jgi:hypothetical protein